MTNPEPYVNDIVVPVKECSATRALESARDAFRMGAPVMGQFFLAAAHDKMERIYGSNKTIGASDRPFPKGS